MDKEKKFSLKNIKLKKGIYKDILAFAVGTTIIVSITKSFANQKNEFDTYKGKRDLRDYEDFLEDYDIDYRNSYAEAQGDIVKIYVKTKGEHIVTLTNPNTVDDIVDLYKMNKEDLLMMNNINENQPLKLGRKLKIYWYKEYDFTLEELDESSKWIYHYIAPGETLSQISDHYDISIEEIKKYNDEIIGDNIQANTTIKIPKKQKTKKLS